MVEWNRIPLPEVLDFREGPGILAKDFHDTGVPLVRLSGVKVGAHILDGCNYLRPEKVEAKWKQFRLERGDVLLSTSASLGEVAVVPEDGVGAIPYTGLIRFRPADERVDPRFVRIALTTRLFKNQIEAMGVGSVMKHFGPMHLRQMFVEVPPKAVQHAIVEIADALDDKIAANAKLATTADELALTLASRFVPSVALGDVAQQSKTAVNPATMDDEFVHHYSLPAYDSGQEPDAVSPGTIKSNKFLITAPGVLVSKLNPRFPRVWNLARLKTGPSLASTEYVALSSEYCSSSLLWSFVAQPRFGAQLEGMVAGTSGSHQRVKPSEILAVEVPDPRGISAEEGREVESLALRAIAARAESRRLAATRDTLLPALMSGRLTVRYAEAAAESAVAAGTSEPEAQANGTLW